MNILRKLGLLCLSITLAVGLTACGKQGPAESAGKSIDQAIDKSGDKLEEVSNKIVRQGDKAGMAIDDTVITTKVKEAIFAEPGLKVMQISVNTTNHVATLSGLVDSQQDSDHAEQIASQIAGVESVNNQLLVKSAN